MTDQNPHDGVTSPDAPDRRDIDAPAVSDAPSRDERAFDASASPAGAFAADEHGRGAREVADRDAPLAGAGGYARSSASRHDDDLLDDADDDAGHAGGDAPRSSVSPASEHASSVPAASHANSAVHAPERARHEPGVSYGVGPFSVREVSLLGIWVVAFLVSFFRTNILDSPSGVLVGGQNVWLSGLWWIPTVALPTAAVGLLVLRRLSPQGIRRVGSLGIDQFASVAFSVAAFVWIAWVWDTVAVFDETGIWTRSWVIWVEAVLLLAGVVLTVFAPVIPPFSSDFRDREEVPAHRNARPIRPVVPRPKTPRPARTAAAHPAHADAVPPVGSYTGSTDLPHGEVDAHPRTSVLPAAHDDHDTDVFAPLRDDADRDRHAHDAPGSRVETEARDHRDDDAHDHSHAQAFWALAPEERDVVDDYGSPIFRIGPTAWALVIEDRGETFVVRHDDGRIGYLHDVSGVTRG